LEQRGRQNGVIVSHLAVVSPRRELNWHAGCYLATEVAVTRMRTNSWTFARWKTTRISFHKGENVMQKAQLEGYRDQLLQLRSRISGELDGLITLVPEKTGHTGNLSSLPMHPADTSTEGLDGELVLIHNEEHILENIEGALVRIENGTYGRCEDCHGEIAETRLKALPYTTRCIQCARKVEQAGT
jgi:DnaK suppressor protein